jgi:tetratricopeptide (TPR) repeat protein
LLRVEPTNRRARIALIQLYADRGAFDQAKPLVEELVAQEPDNREAIDLEWRVYLAAKDWARAVTAGERLIDVDTAAATRDFFLTTIAAADAADDVPRALDLATRGVGRFPNDDELIVLRVQYLRRSGQLTQALAVVKALLTRSPRAPNAWTQKARIEAELALPADTVLASLTQALAVGDERTTIAIAARSYGRSASKDTLPNHFDPLRVALRYYKLSASARAGDTTSFFIGSTSVLLAQRFATAPAPTKTCDIAKEMQALIVDALIELPKGGRAFPKEVIPFLNAAPQLGAYADQLAKAVCPRKD